MSRLDSFIRRITAQRSCLDAAVALIGDLPGPILEFGLGNGRTYDHLRESCPDREIYVFERQVAAHPDCIPDDGHLLLGEFHDTVAIARARIGAPAALAHCDIGSGHASDNRSLASWLGPKLPPLLRPGAIVLSDQAFAIDSLVALPLPQGVADGRYFFYRFEA